MVQQSRIRFRGVDQQPLRGVPATLVIGAVAVPTCFALFDGTYSWLSAALASIVVILLWWKVLARRSVLVITDHEYIIEYDSGEVVTFDLRTLTDMRWQFVPYHGASVTLVNAETSLELPVSRRRAAELAALGSSIENLHPARMYRDVRAMRALGIPHSR